ncbi:BT_3928 family protein [Olleya sp. R77988]|uniref:BT_3928 family protein n=1 Tax=Olleya sp. R77988 TaxID=3093875 RepID=UPI0037C92889
MKYIVHISRVLVGGLFILSGLVKLNDPLGFSYKLQEYFSSDVLNIPFLEPYALGIAVFVVVLEVVLGVFLLIGYKPKFTVWSLLAMILFFTFLTFYAWYFEKVKDCGCFGDFLKLEPFETFIKDVVLTVLILILVFGLKYIKPIFGKLPTIILALLGFVGSLWFGYHVLMHLPTWDFRAYKVGDNIKQNMIYPEDAAQPVIEYTWTFNENGTEKTYVTSGSYPESTGKYIKVETKTISEGYKPKIYDFSIESTEEDFTDKFLTEDHLIMVVAYNLEHAEAEGMSAIKTITDKAIKQGYTVIGLSASGDDAIAVAKKTYGLNFDFYLCDEKAAKTVVRSNPGILKLEKGTVIQKAHWNDVDDIDLPKVERPEPKKVEEIIAYFINDVIATKESVEVLNPDSIERMDVFKGKAQLDSLNIDREKNYTSVIKIKLKE